MKAIYKILNNKNGKFYIGSAKNLRRRWNEHRSELRRGKHDNSYLQHSWNKHGEDSFSFLVLEEIARDEELVPTEQKWLDQTRCYDREIGYNICRIAGSTLGQKISAETKQKISEALKGRPLTLEHRQKLRGLRAGEKNGKAKLTWEKVREMRAIYAHGEATIRQIAKLFGVGQTTTQKIIRRHTWKE